MTAALLVITLGVAIAACTGVDGRPEGAPVVVSTDVVDSSTAVQSSDVARSQASQASATEQARLAAVSAASVSSASVSSAAALSAAEAARLAAEQEAAAELARQLAEQEAAASAAAEAERAAAEQAAAEQAAAEQAAAEEAQRQAAADQARFDAALASGQCTDAPADRVTECVGLAEDSVPPGDAGADGASPDDGSGGWYDGRGWVSPETAQRAIAAGIPVGGNVPNYLRCGTLCGESPTSGEVQSQWLEDQGLIDENGALTGSGG